MQAEQIIELVKWGIGGLGGAVVLGLTAVWTWFKKQLADTYAESIEHRAMVQNQLSDCETDREAMNTKLSAASEVVGALLACGIQGCGIAGKLGLHRRQELKEQLETPRPEKIGPSPTPTTPPQQIK